MEEPNLEPQEYMRILDHYDISLILNSSTLQIKLFFKEQKSQYYQGTFTLETIPSTLKDIFGNLQGLYK